MAQLVERVLGKDEVSSSNLLSSSKNPSLRTWIFLFSKKDRLATVFLLYQITLITRTMAMITGRT